MLRSLGRSKAVFTGNLIIAVGEMEEIPIELIFNWDQTGLNLVSVSTWTMAAKGSKRVENCGLSDKRQFTGVLCGTLLGDFLPVHRSMVAKRHIAFQLICSLRIGTSHTSNHWSNETTMITYIEEIIAPYVSKT